MANNDSLEKLMQKYTDELFRYNSIRNSKPHSASASNEVIKASSPTVSNSSTMSNDEYITEVNFSPSLNTVAKSESIISNIDSNEYITEVSSALMSEVPSTPAQPPMSQPNGSTNNSGGSKPVNGKILVQVFTARRTMPVPNASVNIYYSSNPTKRVVDTLITDDAGKTDSVVVPAVPKELSEQPQSVNPYTAYNISVSHPEFADVNVKNVSVFEGITAVLDIDMMPKDVAPNGNSNDYVVIEPSDL